MTSRKQARRPRRDQPTSLPQERRPAQPDALKSEGTSVRPSVQGPTSAPRDVLGILGLALLVAVSYFPATQAGFIWDDLILTSSKAVQKWSGLWHLWFDTENTYRGGDTREGHFWPLPYSTFWLEHKLWGFAPVGYHVVNLLLHFANTWLVWRLLRRLAVPGAWLIAAVFAVHPVHVEAVAWVMGRKDLLSALFYLLAALVWLRFVDAPRAGHYVLAMTLFVAGLLSKSVAVTLPVALLIGHWWQQGRVTSTDVLRLLPFFLVGLGIGLTEISFYQRRQPLFFDYSAVDRLLISARALWFYVGKLLWPADLAVLYPRWDIDPLAPLGWGYVAAALTALGLLWRFRSRMGHGPLAGVAFFAVTLAPMLGFVDNIYMTFSFVADRYQYLASLGLIVVFVGCAAHGVDKLSGAWRYGALTVAGMILVVLGTLTWQQASIYRDDVTFYTHVIALNPVAHDAHLNLGAALLAQGRKEEALAAALTAVEQRPDSADAYVNVGEVLVGLRRFDEAEQYLRRGYKLDRRHPMILLSLANALDKQERYEEALEVYDAVLELGPEDIRTHVGRGSVLIRIGRYADVFEALKPVVALQAESLPSERRLHARLHTQLSLAARKLGRLDEAEKHHRRALDLVPEGPGPMQSLAESLREQGLYEEALEWYGLVVELHPWFGMAYAGMGDTLFHAQRYAEAADRLERAVPLLADSDPSTASVLHVFLARIEQDQGRLEAAEKQYEQALAMNPRNPEALRRLISLRYEQQRHKETLDLFRTLIDVEPDNTEVHVNMGVVLHQLGRTEEALRSLDQALSLEPNLKKARTTREQVLQSLHENEP